MRFIFLVFSSVFLIFSACTKDDDCTKTVVVEGYNMGGGAYYPGNRFEVPCDLPDPEPLVDNSKTN